MSRFATLKNASYQLKQYSDGSYYVKTIVNWSKPLGNNNFRTGYKEGEIYDQQKFIKWLGKYGLALDRDDIALIPPYPPEVMVEQKITKERMGYDL